MTVQASKGYTAPTMRAILPIMTSAWVYNSCSCQNKIPPSQWACMSFTLEKSEEIECMDGRLGQTVHLSEGKHRK